MKIGASFPAPTRTTLIECDALLSPDYSGLLATSWLITDSMLCVVRCWVGVVLLYPRTYWDMVNFWHLYGNSTK